ncbi:hypothetical protein HHK36_002048 [Tetracentron sinense]|uniref:Uncharacterized protein n=1 Tax=Tetracentron sinense TaxID=13715 RepID=A0A835DVC2_TETSI|nr:hypothetical protein HHK36_002048 [Tetracentron sinense]
MMARFLLVCLILGEVLMVQGMAHESQKVGTGGVVGFADAPVASGESSEGEKSGVAEAPGIRRMGKHHSSGESVAGGDVIIGGLATAIFAAVFCYIRVTRRRNDDS